MRIGNDWVMYDDNEAGAGGLGSSAPDTASDDETLGLVVMEAVLPMPPVVTGASFLGSSAPDTASDDEALGPVVVEAVLPMLPVVTGASFLGSSAPDTASNIELWYNYRGRCMWKQCS